MHFLIHPVLFMIMLLVFPIGFFALMIMRHRICPKNVLTVSDVIWHVIPFLMLLSFLFFVVLVAS